MYLIFSFFLLTSEDPRIKWSLACRDRQLLFCSPFTSKRFEIQCRFPHFTCVLTCALPAFWPQIVLLFFFFFGVFFVGGLRSQWDKNGKVFSVEEQTSTNASTAGTHPQSSPCVLLPFMCEKKEREREREREKKRRRKKNQLYTPTTTINNLGKK